MLVSLNTFVSPMLVTHPAPPMFQVKLNIAERTRALEIVGFSVSLAALLVSLAIFCRFR